MRILFVNHAFPGTFGALASAFASAGHDVLFASGFRRREFSLPGVRHIVLAPPKESRASGAKCHAPGLEGALAAGGQALHAFVRLAEMDLAPDMVITSAVDGYGLFCGEAFPRAFRVAWTEAQAGIPGEKVRGETAFTRHLLQCRYAVDCHAFVCLGTGEQSQFAARLSCGLDVPYAVNSEWFSPGAAGGPELVLFYSGRQSADRSLAAVRGLLKARGRCHVAVLCAFLLAALLYKPYTGRWRLTALLPFAVYFALLVLTYLIPEGRFACAFVRENLLAASEDMKFLTGQLQDVGASSQVSQAAGRLVLWQHTLSIIAQKPLFVGGRSISRRRSPRQAFSFPTRRITST